MKNIKLLPLLFLFFFYNNAFTQDLDLENIGRLEFEEKEDYIGFEEDLLKYIDWLQTTSLKNEYRKGVHAVVMKWAIGTPTMNIDLFDYVNNFTKKNEDFLVLFIAGWIKQVMENPDDKEDKLKSNLAAVNFILDFYQQGKKMGVKKDKRVAKILKKRENGELEDWVKKQIE